LDHIAAQHAQALPATVKSLLRTLGSNPDTGGEQGQALVSYLLFESGYTQALIALGQADAERQSADIHRFFGWPSPS
jgi:NTE family protein